MINNVWYIIKVVWLATNFIYAAFRQSYKYVQGLVPLALSDLELMWMYEYFRHLFRRSSILWKVAQRRLIFTDVSVFGLLATWRWNR